MKKIDLKCSNCGANMQISADRQEAVCPYCHNRFLIEKQETIEELEEKAERISYATEMGQRNAIEESRKKETKRKILGIGLMLVVVITLFGGACFLGYIFSERMDNPFECISLKFSGADGSGVAEIVDTKKCENFNNIEYVLSRDDKLREGDRITVTASSASIRFGVSSKEYTVSGLSLYLSDLNSLNDQILSKLHTFSYDYLKNDYPSSFSGEVVSLTPYKIYLYTNEDTENVLYDVYSISIKTKSGNVYDKYVAACYKNFLIFDNSELFSYDKLSNCGTLVLAGKPGSTGSDYVGYIKGFQTISDFRTYVSKNNDGSFIIKER